MNAIEVMGTVDEQGQLSLDVPLTVDKHTRVKVIVLLPEEVEKENKQDNEEISESAVESFRQGWYDAMSGNTLPVSQLWEGIDLVLNCNKQVTVNRRSQLGKNTHRT